MANQPIADDVASECVCYFLIKKTQNEKRQTGMARTKRGIIREENEEQSWWGEAETEKMTTSNSFID